MQKMKFYLAVLLTAFFVFIADFPAFAQDSVVRAANDFLKVKFNLRGDYYTPANASGRLLMTRPLEAITGTNETWNIIVYGDWHGDTKTDEIGRTRARYVGYSKYDEDITNPHFPPDASGSGRLDSRNWIARPWENSSLREYIKSQQFDNSPDPWLIQRLRDGLAWAAKCNGYDPPDPNSDLYLNPQKYVHIILPPAENIWGMGRMWHVKPDGSIWYVSVPLGPPLAQKPDLVAVSIDPGVTGAEPDSSYTGKVIFKNDSGVKVTGAPVEVRSNGVVVLSTTADFGPGETKTFTFTWVVPGSGIVELKGIINGSHKIEEATYGNNEVSIRVPVKEKQVSSGPGSLTFQAVSQLRDITRPPNTAKWTDWVTATLNPPAPTPPKGWLSWWRVTSAELTYPKQNPEFTFGSPYPPAGTVTVPMNPNGHEATVEFQEDWAMDGAGIYCLLEDRMMAEYPKEYTLTARYTVEYEYCWTECDEDSCWTECATASTSGTVSGNLLVNGTGVDSLAE